MIAELKPCKYCCTLFPKHTDICPMCGWSRLYHGYISDEPQGYNPPPKDNSGVRPKPTASAPKAIKECKHEWMPYRWETEKDNQRHSAYGSTVEIYDMNRLTKVICKHCLEKRDV